MSASDTPRTDAYPTALVERTIDEALHPRGMSTHSGRVTLDCSHVLAILGRSRALERELSAATLKGVRLGLEAATKTCNDQKVIDPLALGYNDAVIDCAYAVEKINPAEVLAKNSEKG